MAVAGGVVGWSGGRVLVGRSGGLLVWAGARDTHASQQQGLRPRARPLSGARLALRSARRSEAPACDAAWANARTHARRLQISASLHAALKTRPIKIKKKKHHHHQSTDGGAAVKSEDGGGAAAPAAAAGGASGGGAAAGGVKAEPVADVKLEGGECLLGPAW